jgi:hypothetical protein
MADITGSAHFAEKVIVFQFAAYVAGKTRCRNWSIILRVTSHDNTENANAWIRFPDSDLRMDL